MKKMTIKIISQAIKASLLLSLSPLAVAETDSNMDTIVVTASGFEQQIKNAPATISVITAKDIDNKPYRDVTDALRDIPGVNISGGGDGTDIGIRGMDAKYTLILIDGKKVNTRETRPNSDGSGFEQGWLPPLSAIERIEVVRGPMSSLYGSDAMGGVINVITKKVLDAWQGSVRLESVFQQDSQANNYYNSNFSLMGPLIADRLGLQLYGQYSDRGEDEFLNGHAEQKLRSLNGKLFLQATDNQSFQLDFGRSLQNSLATRGKTRALTRKDDSERDNRRNSYALTHQGHWDGFTSKTFFSYEGNNNPKREMKVENSDFDSQFLIPLENHMLTIGGHYTYQNLNDKGNELNTLISKIDRWNYALYAEDEWQIVDNFALTGGIRFNKDENYGTNWNPRIYAVWDINENYTLKGGYSSGYATPLLRYVVADWGQVTGGGNRDGVIIGNANLKPEKSDNIELGLEYSDESGMNASATAFYTKFKDKIQSYYLCDDTTNKKLCSANGVSGFDFVQSRENVDKADIKGVELSLKTPLFDTFLLNSSYTWTKSEQKSGVNKGLSLNRTPRQKFTTQLDWFVTQQWDLWAKVAYYGEETEAGKNGVQGKKYPGYTLWDLGASYSVNKQTKLYTGIYNLFDKDVENTDFGKTLEGRRYWVGTEISF
ncbi:TonB-dependent receptor [Orbus sturtevantii]|uniref:TonB-dependent receptor domain-containing protein n=1 Tax=Orbus sturtevantii TaxID=3074109 RepID=UPI00370D8308